MKDAAAKLGYRVEKHPLLFPHRILTYLFNTVGLTLDLQVLSKFWDNAIQSRKPNVDETSRSCIPLGLYGDAAQLVTKIRKEKMLLLTLNIPIFRPRTIRYSRFVLWAVDFYRLVPHKTINTVLRWITWSLNACYEGLNPSVRMGGRPLNKQEQARAGTPLTEQGWRFQLVEIRGDWEFHKLIWQMPKCSWNALHVCFKCPAECKSGQGFEYWNCEEGSAWAQQPFTTTDFMLRRLPDRDVCAKTARTHSAKCWSQGPLVNLKKFNVYCIKWCTMHAMNLGLTMPANGGSLTPGRSFARCVVNSGCCSASECSTSVADHFKISTRRRISSLSRVVPGTSHRPFPSTLSGQVRPSYGVFAGVR